LDTIRKFDTNYAIVSVGFDIAVGDPVGGFNITVEGMREVGRRIADLSHQKSVPMLIVQEGGYLLERLGENAAAFLYAFA
jgi:acetoin utilization deacetylase AcuC-like enzyme